MSETPLWRRTFNRVERVVGERLEDLTATDGFARTLATGADLQRGVRRRVEGVTSSALHLANLPARSDISRLSRQVTALQKQLGDLTAELERPDLTPDPPTAPTTQKERGSGTRPPPD